MGCRLDEVSLQHDPVVDLPLLAWQDRLLGFVHGGLEWRFTDLNWWHPCSPAEEPR